MYIFRKIPSGPKGQNFRINVVWQEKAFTLTVIQGNDALTASVTEDHIKEQASVNELNVNRYFETLKTYISEERKDVDFNLSKKTFTVYCKVDANKHKLKVKYFTIDLEKCEYVQCVENLLDTFNQSMCDMSIELSDVKTKYETLEAENKQYEKKLVEFVDAKVKNDKKILSNFLLVLNEKKKRIQYLTDLLDALNAGREPPPNTSEQNNKTIKEEVASTSGQSSAAVKKKELISDSEPDQTTDDDSENSDSKDHGISETEPVPSTSKENILDVLRDDSPPRKIIKICKNSARKSEENEVKANEINSKNLTEEQKHTKSSDETTVDKNLTVLNFNTQDLLDGYVLE